MVVSYWNSTSNHNEERNIVTSIALYLIEILHQTTTMLGGNTALVELYLIEILHQTTTYIREAETLRRCILLKFYIKPQPQDCQGCQVHRCILLKFYIKPQLNECCCVHRIVVSYWNSTSNHNTVSLFPELSIVVSYWNSTSNHNVGPHIDW